MKKILFIIIIFISSYGCTTLNKDSSISSQNKNDVFVIESSNKEPLDKSGSIDDKLIVDLQNIEEQKIKDSVVTNGVIFAKTDFQGVLKTSYVQLNIESLDNENNKFRLYIGDVNSQSFNLDFKVVQPGYFFIELPAGKYKISSISIPVGSTNAEEQSNIFFEVLPNSIVYAGTLRLTGTKEKIKLGGVPVLKPGFEYVMEIVDDRSDASKAFNAKYPDFTSEIIVKLMQGA